MWVVTTIGDRAVVEVDRRGARRTRPLAMSSDMAWTVEDAAISDELRRGAWMTERTRPPPLSSDVAWTVEDAAAGDELRRETWTMGPPTTMPCARLLIPRKYHLIRGKNRLILDRYNLILCKYHLIRGRNRLIPSRYHMISRKYRLIPVRYQDMIPQRYQDLITNWYHFVLTGFR